MLFPTPEAPAACYCTALRDATRRVGALYDQALASLGIGVAQLSLLRAVERRRALTITALGNDLSLDRSTVGRNVRVLERAGHLCFARGDADQREIVVALTAAGNKVVNDARPLWECAQKKVESMLSVSGAHELLATLNSL